MPLSNRAAVTYVIHMLYERCFQRKEHAEQTMLMSEKDLRGPPERAPTSHLKYPNFYRDSSYKGMSAFGRFETFFTRSVVILRAVACCTALCSCATCFEATNGACILHAGLQPTVELQEASMHCCIWALSSAHRCWSMGAKCQADSLESPILTQATSSSTGPYIPQVLKAPLCSGRGAIAVAGCLRSYTGCMLHSSSSCILWFGHMHFCATSSL